MWKSLRAKTPPFERVSSLYPRGPRSCSGYSVPCRQRLIGLMCPTCRHIPISSSGLIRDAFAVPCDLGPQVVPHFRYCSFLPCCPLRPRVSAGCTYPVLPQSALAFNRELRFRQFTNIPIIRFRWRSYVEALRFTCCDLVGCLPPLANRVDFRQPTETFTSALPVRSSPSPLTDMTTVVAG